MRRRRHRRGPRPDANGVFVDTAAPQGIADAVLDLLADPAKRARLGAAARATVLEAFTVDHFVRKYAEVYEGLFA